MTNHNYDCSKLIFLKWRTDCRSELTSIGTKYYWELWLRVQPLQLLFLQRTTRFGGHAQTRLWRSISDLGLRIIYFFSSANQMFAQWVGGVVVRALDSRSCREFDSWPPRLRAATLDKSFMFTCLYFPLLGAPVLSIFIFFHIHDLLRVV